MEITKTNYKYNNKDINSNSLKLNTNKLLTLIDNINIYNLRKYNMNSLVNKRNISKRVNSINR